MLDLSTPQTIKPIKTSRRTESLAWILAILTIVVRLLFPAEGFFRIGGSILAAFFLFSAVIISIGNWINRSIELEVSERGLQLFNGVTKTSIFWEEVARIEVFKGRFNDKIRIVSQTSGINLDVVSVETLDEQPGNRIGFRDGDKILNTILAKCSFENQNKNDVQGYYYYSKE